MVGFYWSGDKGGKMMINEECNFGTTTVYLIRPPEPSLDRPWIFSTDNNIILRHPLTSKPYFSKQPRQNIDISNLNPTTLAVSHHAPGLPFDKLLVIPNSTRTNTNTNTLLGLYDGGHLRGCHPYSNEWVKVSRCGIQRFDDLVIYNDKVYALGRYGSFYPINIHLQRRTICICTRTLVSRSIPFTLSRSGWRKRVVVDYGNNVMYLVVRTSERMFKVYKLITPGNSNSNSNSLSLIQGFDGNQVLFVTKDHYFFQGTSQYANCIVFTEGAFPRYGSGSFWEFTPFSEELGFESSGDEENFAVFRLVDGRFGKVGDNKTFPEIDWSPPGWIFDALSVSAAEFQSRLSTHSLEKSRRSFKRELEEDKDGQNGEVQFDSNDSMSKDEEELEEMESDSDSQEMEDVEMHVNVNTEDDPSAQQDVCHVVSSSEPGTTDAQTLSVSPTEKVLNGGNNATEEETLRKNITKLAPGACTSSTSADHRTNLEFEGFDIRPDLVSLLQKIWVKHGNIIEQSIFRSGDLVARALESLATMV